MSVKEENALAKRIAQDLKDGKTETVEETITSSTQGWKKNAADRQKKLDAGRFDALDGELSTKVLAELKNLGVEGGSAIDEKLSHLKRDHKHVDGTGVKASATISFTPTSPG